MCRIIFPEISSYIWNITRTGERTHYFRRPSLRVRGVLSVLMIAAAMILGSCGSTKSPVGRAKSADSIREILDGFGKRPAKAVKDTENQDMMLTAGINNNIRSAVASDAVSANKLTDGDPEGTKLTLWTYSDTHVNYYRKMLKKWNDEDPDYTLEITFEVKPYEELHTSFVECLKKGKDIPDICDIDAYRFTEICGSYSDELYPLDVAVAPYVYDIHQARMDVYKGKDEKRYAVPFRMGAAVQYWNMELLEEAGITQKEVDAVKTWEDYKALGEKFKNSPGQSSRYFAVVNPEEPVWPMLALAEYSEDQENAGSATANMSKEYTGWIDTGIAKSSDDTVSDIASGNVASYTGSLAFMDRFVQDMHDMSGKWYITKCPVFEDGQPCSVCLDDIPSVISARSPAAALAADYICYAKMYPDNAKSSLWPDLSYDVCNESLWENEDFTHDVTNEYDTFFRNYPYDVLNEIKDRIATVKP